ncbi:YopX protein [Vibrio phage 1.033.O._10N.222.49.B8]|nr:YopX protein [Vibrio phage 1.033.O._10N.222.49.B8]
MVKYRQFYNGRMEFFGQLEPGHFRSPPSIDFEKYPPMQYTGLKDKNGVEIYLGDLVVCQLHNRNPPAEEVTYSCQRGFYPVQEPIDYGEIYAEGGDWLVVGNIHENPDIAT